MSPGFDQEEFDRLRRQLATHRVLSPDQRFLQYLGAMPLATVVWDGDLRIRSWNAAAAAMFGYSAEESLGANIVDLLVPSAVRPLVEGLLIDLLESSRPSRSTNQNLTKDGTEILCEWCNTPIHDNDGKQIGAVSIARDVSRAEGLGVRLNDTRTALEAEVEDRTKQLAKVSDRRRREAESRVASATIASRLASIRTVAAGFAHEVLSPLRAIEERANAALQRLDQPERVTRDLYQIMDNVKRCSVIVALVVKFLDNERTEKWANDLNPLVVDAVERAREEVGPKRSTRFDLQLAEHLPPVVLNPEEIIAAFTYLMVAVANAATEGTTIEISTCEVESCVAVQIVEHSVDDTSTVGHPLEDGHINLSSSHGILFDHDGNIEVDFDSEASAAITLEFPIAVEKLGRLNHGNDTWYEDSTPAVDGACETVLVVEDDDHVRLVVIEALSSGGYRPLSASSAEEALAVVDCCQHKIDLVVVDVELPRMKGPELFAELKLRVPELEVLFVSGYSGGALAPHSTFLAKPFTQHVLMEKVRQVLDARHTQ